MSHGKMPLVLSLVFILCGLFNSIFCEKQQTSPDTITPVLLNRLAALSQNTEADYEAFAQELFKALLIDGPRKNIIFSPVSISITLATLALGIRSTTRTNPTDVLERDLRKLRVLDKQQALQYLAQMLPELEKKKQLKHKDIFFIDRNQKIDQMFQEEIARTYKVDIQMTDFKDKETTKKAINQFSINRYPLMKEDFFVNEETKVQVDMMRKTERMIYSRSEELLATMVKMPCKENASIILVLPDAGKFDFTLKEMAAKRARLQKASDFRLMHLVLPKIEISSKIELKHLPEIDLEDIFTPETATWNTTKKAASSILEVKTCLPQAVLYAAIEVKEDGLTEDTAKDKDFWKVPVDKKEVPMVVKFDRPFILFVVDEITQRDLFVAKVFNPQTE
uniref:Serpin domain-containing protein n=1 Tax=Catagonus wagneri TaxID=51154 RepID=A0A8C3X884_9CETA